MYTVFLKFSFVFLSHWNKKFPWSYSIFACLPSVIASSLIASCSIDFLNSSYSQPPSLPSRPLHLLFPLLRIFFLEVYSSDFRVVRTQPKFHHFRNTLLDYNIERAFPSLVFSIRFLLEFPHSSFPHFNGLIYYKSKYVICHVYGYLSCSIANFYCL